MLKASQKTEKCDESAMNGFKKMDSKSAKQGASSAYFACLRIFTQIEEPRTEKFSAGPRRLMWTCLCIKNEVEKLRTDKEVVS